MYEQLKNRIKQHEGYLGKIYIDSLGKRTIGYGHLLTEDDDFVDGIIYDKDILENLFEKDFAKAVKGADELLIDYDVKLPVREVIIEMVFQLGKSGVAKFKNMFAALKNKDYIRAAAEMINSNWYRQSPNRCEELSQIVSSCY